MIPMLPPNSGPRARLIMSGRGVWGQGHSFGTGGRTNRDESQGHMISLGQGENIATKKSARLRNKEKLWLRLPLKNSSIHYTFKFSSSSFEFQAATPHLTFHPSSQSCPNPKGMYPPFLRLSPPPILPDRRGVEERRMQVSIGIHLNRWCPSMFLEIYHS